MKRIIVLFGLLFVCSASYADDVYLKTGFVLRNVQILDSTSGQLHVLRDGNTATVLQSDVHRIEVKAYDRNSMSKYELYSQEMAGQYKPRVPQEPKPNVARTEIRLGPRTQSQTQLERGRITTADSKVISAQNLILSKDTVEFQAENSPTWNLIPLLKVKLIQEYKGNYKNTGTWIGAIAGASIGLVVALGTKEEETKNENGLIVTTTTIQTWPIYVFVLVGGATGGLIGSKSEDWKTVYGTSTASTENSADSL